MIQTGIQESVPCNRMIPPLYGHYGLSSNVPSENYTTLRRLALWFFSYYIIFLCETCDATGVSLVGGGPSDQ
jgi:hypothetical protein